MRLYMDYEKFMGEWETYNTWNKDFSNNKDVLIEF